MKTSTRVIGCASLFGAVVTAVACASQQSTPQQSAGADPMPSATAAASAAAAPSSAAPASSAQTAASAAPAAPGAGGAATVEPPASPKDESAPHHPAKLIMATIHGKSGAKLSGKVTLSDKGGQGVKLFVEVEGAKPGTHGIHIHQYGDCSARDGSSAGDHFNPEGHEHGLPDKEARHLGDLGNITVGQDGKGTLEIVVAGGNLKDTDPHSFIGRGLIIHEKKDNGGQPAGNAGARVGCAEIK